MKTTIRMSEPKKPSEKRVLADEALRCVTGGAKARPVKTFSTSTIRFDPYKSFNFR